MSTNAASLRDVHWGPGVTVLATHRAGLVAVNKPAGVLSHPNEPADLPRSLIQAPYDLDAERYDATPRLWLLHRLDGPTSGVLLLATDEALAESVRNAFAGKDVHKTYRALVFGNPFARSDTWTDRLAVERGRGAVRTRVVQGRPAQAPAAAVTDVRMLAKRETEHGWITHLELRPRTGRTHQLRVQCQKHNLPIIGDQTYGDFKRNRTFAKTTEEKRLFLHALSVTLKLGTGPKAIQFSAEAPLPTPFRLIGG
jgi:23S rRNA-/tRNA-specific pseudouridylate synthase